MTGSRSSGSRRVVLVTTSRADFGIYESIVIALRESADLEPALLVSGSHVPRELGATDCGAAAARMALAARIPLAGVVPVSSGDGSARAIAEAMGAVTAGAARVLEADRPDILLVLGDRYEMHAVTVAAATLRIPVAHIHGGEESEGALDNQYRHSITKLSHLHFCATDLSRARLLAMGEEPWRVHVTGAPALDGIASLDLDDRQTLLARLGLRDAPFFLATFHPETIDTGSNLDAFDALITALDRHKVTTVFSRANADEGGAAINHRLEAYARDREWLVIRDSLGRLAYFSAMRHASLMLGNSSSGIIEAASFGLPVINIGNRQRGRERSANTIDVPSRTSDILRAIDRALSEPFRSAARDAPNVYGRGAASVTIRTVLEQVPLGTQLLVKAFHFTASPA